MPWEILFANRGCVRRLSGHVTYRDFLESREAIGMSPEADEVRWVLDDSRDVESLTLSPEEVALEQAIVAKRLFVRGERWAVLSRPGNNVRSVVQQFDQAPAPSGKIETRLFEDIIAAMDWLCSRSDEVP